MIDLVLMCAQAIVEGAILNVEDLADSMLAEVLWHCPLRLFFTSDWLYVSRLSADRCMIDMMCQSVSSQHI